MSNSVRPVCQCGCGELIPLEKIKKNGKASPPKYVDHYHFMEHRKATGFYRRFAQTGLAKQRAMQQETGVRPGHDKRSQAMKEHNRMVPRRHVSGWHKHKRKTMEQPQQSRAKHGQYNAERKLPDNTGQVVGDGSRVWLMETVAQHWPDLADRARQRPGDRYSWLVNELRSMNDKQSTAIVEEYQLKIRASNRERAQRDRRHQLAQYEAQLQTSSGERLEYLQKCIAKLKKQIEKAEGS